jgi:hypothetical protein
MNHVLSCPIDQLHIGGYLACDVDANDLDERQAVSDLRYIAAKRLKTCESSEFSAVSNRFKLQRDFVYRVIRSGEPLPPSPKDWLPALYDALDATILYWKMTNEDEDNYDPRDHRGNVGAVAKPLPVESNRLHSRGLVSSDLRPHSGWLHGIVSRPSYSS